MKAKKIIICITAVFLALSLTIGAFAAVHNDIDTADKFVTAFSTDTDPEVIINLTGDIDGLLASLSANEGQTYIINGKDYVIKDLAIDYGSGTVSINADLASDHYNGLSVGGSVNVTVTGDISSKESNGVSAYGDAVVTVNGNVSALSEDVDVDGNPVTSGKTGILTVENASVTVTGNVEANGDGIKAGDNSVVTVNKDVDANGKGIDSDDSAYVTVGGDVTAMENGINSGGNSYVEVKGNVTSTDSEGINAYGESTVDVGGSVTGASGNPDAVNMDDPGSYSDGSAAVNAWENATVTVGGDVTGGDAYGNWGEGGPGISAEDTSTVVVGGNVSGGNVTANDNLPDSSISYGGDGIIMDSTATVSVGGDVMGGDTNGTYGIGGNGVYIRLVPLHSEEEGEEGEEGEGGDTAEPGLLYVNGTVSAGNSSTSKISVSGIYYGTGYLELPSPDMFKFSEDAYFPSVNNLLNNLSMRLEGVYSVLTGVSGMSEDEANEIIDAEVDEIMQLLAEIIGEDNPEMENLDEETVKEVNSAIIASFNNFVSLQLGNAYLTYVNDMLCVPDAIIWKVEGNDNSIEAVGSDLGTTVAAALNEMHNYLVRIAETNGGTISSSMPYANPGETVTLTAKPDNGYVLSSVSLNGQALKAENGVYSFVMPEYGGVLVSAVFTASKASPKTGDDSMSLLWGVMALMGMGGISVLAIELKKSKAK